MKRHSKIGVVGAGTMGSAIAQHFAMKGMDVVLMDQSAESLERGLGLLRAGVDQAKEREIIDDAICAAVLARVRGSNRAADLADREFIVEAVFEDLDVKRSLFQELERVVRPECVLASNTSSFMITDIAEGLRHPDRVIGAHYFFHAAKNKLVEVIPGERSGAEVVRQAMLFYESIDKLPILVKDAPGFAVNRFFVPWLNEAVRLLEEGVGSIKDIDRIAVETFGIGMGPFALMNATGVPIAMHAGCGLAKKLGASYAPAKRLEEQVAAGKPWDLESAAVPGSAQADPERVKTRLLESVLGVAAKMVEEGVTDAASADLGARVGLRWPKGPFEMSEALGRPVSFRLSWVRSHTVRDAGFLEIDLPDRMNPLGPEVMRQLEQGWRSLDANPEIRKIFFTGRGKAFVAGADIKFFVDAIEAKDTARIQRFTESGQALFSEISRSKKTVVVYLGGLTLGGGLELALACHYRIATPKAVLAFPETGIGIYPGLGGTQRAPRLIGKGLAKYLIATGQFIDAATALEYGLVDQVVDPLWDTDELVDWKIPSGRPLLELRPKARQLANAFESFGGIPSFLPEHEKWLARKAPRALRIAMELVDLGSGLDIDEALRLETARLSEIFATDDALIGLKSVLTKTRPTFTGA